MSVRPFVRATVVLVVAASALAGGCGTDRTPDPPEAAAAATAVETVDSPQQPEVVRSEVGRGGTLDSALRKLDVPDDRRLLAIETLGSAVDLRKLSPRSGLSVVRDAGGEVTAVSCRPALDHFVRVRFEPDGSATAEHVEVPVRRTLETAGGVVESTVAEALSSRTDAVTLTLLFADIFQWDVDLFVDPRPGDRVRMVYETLNLDAPDDDLPPFGETGLETGAYLGIGRVLAASYDGAMAASVAYWVAEDGNGGNYYDPEGRSLRKTFLKSPLNYRRISSRFTNRRRHPITRKVVPHHGVDFAAASGTPVVAAADGKVVSAGWDGALGKAVRIRHGNGYRTIYGHLRGFAKGIRSGVHVRQNQVIGYVGSTGRATGPHLHYTMQYNGRAINPLGFKNPPSEPLEASYFPHLDRVASSLSPVLMAIDTGSDGTGIASAAAVERPGVGG